MSDASAKAGVGRVDGIGSLPDDPIDAVFRLEATERYYQTRIGDVGSVGRYFIGASRTRSAYADPSRAEHKRYRKQRALNLAKFLVGSRDIPAFRWPKMRWLNEPGPEFIWSEGLVRLVVRWGTEPEGWYVDCPYAVFSAGVNYSPLE
jgi:hypothetical protein